MAASGAEMYAVMEEAERSAYEFSGGAPSGKQKIANFVGGRLGSFAGTALGKKMFQYVSPYGNNLEDITSNAQAKLAMKVMEMEDSTDPTSMKGTLLRLLSPGISRDAGSITNTLANDPTKPAIYDIATRQSIVEIIPGYLAKILKQVTITATGNRNTEELTFPSLLS